GAASFTLTGSSTLTGNSSPGQTIWVLGQSNGGHTNVIMPNGFTNGGSLRMESTDSTYQSNINIAAGPLINTRTADINLASGGSREIVGNVDNRATLNVSADANFFGTTSNNAGTLTIATGRKLAIPSSRVFNQNGGTLQTSSGGSLETSSATFNFNGGTVTGQ